MAAHSSVPVGEDVWRDFRLLASDGEVGALEQRHACEVTIVASSSGGQVFSSS